MAKKCSLSLLCRLRLVTGLGIGFSGTRFVLTDPNGYGFQHTLAVARAEEVSEALDLFVGILADGVENVCGADSLMMFG